MNPNTPAHTRKDFFKTVHLDVVHFNTTRVIGQNSLGGWSTTDVEIEGRHQVDDMVRFLKKSIHGFEHSYLIKMVKTMSDINR